MGSQQRLLEVSRHQRIRRSRILQEAEGYLELGMPRYALKSLSRLGPTAEFGCQALYLWGDALQALGRYDEALKPLRRASKIAPDDIYVWVAMGWCYKRTGRIDLAIDSLENALILGPEEAIVRYNLACYLSLIGEKQRCLEHLSEAFALDPHYRDMVDHEPDFDPLRGDSDFQALTSLFA